MYVYICRIYTCTQTRVPSLLKPKTEVQSLQYREDKGCTFITEVLLHVYMQNYYMYTCIHVELHIHVHTQIKCYMYLYIVSQTQVRGLVVIYSLGEKGVCNKTTVVLSFTCRIHSHVEYTHIHRQEYHLCILFKTRQRFSHYSLREKRCILYRVTRQGLYLYFIQ